MKCSNCGCEESDHVVVNFSADGATSADVAICPNRIFKPLISPRPATTIAEAIVSADAAARHAELFSGCRQ